MWVMQQQQQFSWLHNSVLVCAVQKGKEQQLKVRCMQLIASSPRRICTNCCYNNIKKKRKKKTHNSRLLVMFGCISDKGKATTKRKRERNGKVFVNPGKRNKKMNSKYTNKKKLKTNLANLCNSLRRMHTYIHT